MSNGQPKKKLKDTHFCFVENYVTAIPNKVMALVHKQILRPFDILLYAYFQGRIANMEFCTQSVQRIAFDLDVGTSTVKEGISRLVKEKIIERKGTIRNSLTFLLVKPVFPKKKVGKNLII